MSKQTKTDIEKFENLMNEFGINVFKELDEHDFTEIRLQHKEHNTIPIFYFDKEGNYVDITTAVAGAKCQACGTPNHVAYYND